MTQPFHAVGAAAGPLLGSLAPAADMITGLPKLGFAFLTGDHTARLVSVFHHGTGMVYRIASILTFLGGEIRRLFTASVYVSAQDELHRQVATWLAANTVNREYATAWTAQTVNRQMMRWTERNPRLYAKYRDAKGRGSSSSCSSPSPDPRETLAVEYAPVVSTSWFLHQGRFYGVLRGRPQLRSGGVVTHGDLEIWCLGWSAAPVMALLDTCREAAVAAREHMVTVRGWDPMDFRWTSLSHKPVRALDTIYLDEAVKQALLRDIVDYLDPARRRFYAQRGIPYRRGYLLHGPPGCGKTSLSAAIAGHVGLDMYVLQITPETSEYGLDLQFRALPSRCLVLLEDIDVAGLSRDASTSSSGGDNNINNHHDDNDNKEKAYLRRRRGPVTTSALLNLLDGVASQEGRIVLMTTNYAEHLDAALLRPGRVDVQVHMGHMDAGGAARMFARFFRPDDGDGHVEGWSSSSSPSSFPGPDLVADDAAREALAAEFAAAVPAHAFTPAQVQGYLLRHLGSARGAVRGVRAWVAREERTRREQLRSQSVAAAAAQECAAQEKAEPAGETETTPTTTTTTSTTESSES
ncbi:P-loop containing nucleoside triphosphate hydrolase protein [Xylariomycetidae sp. FL0641]|nr:P-loop containing nucleoside triphosphate hydrolase protein [Xylariomycetidae sp. FL0641]